VGVYLASGFDSVETWHGDIEQNDIRRVTLNQCNRLTAVRSFSNNFESSLSLQKKLQSGPQHSVVVG
jgi:hypothetical protein